MKFIQYAFTSSAKVNERILLLIKDKFAVDIELYEKIADILSDFFAPLKKDINVFIEYPYVDKVYRDSYYTYFSTKYRDYQRDCIRISLFNNTVKEKNIIDKVDHAFLENNFLGYCVLRPTFPDIIGRNLLRKESFKNNSFVTCIHKENVLVNGVKLHVEGFPHSSQDQESITCAETTVWAMMEYFGHKYAEYKPVLPSTIINKLNEYADKRMLPSSGLTSEQISFALKDFGFGTMIYSEQEDDFFANLSVYIESGFPVIVILENDTLEFGHAILMIGRQQFKNIDLLQAFSESKKEDKIIPFSSIIKNYVVQDDNLPPYSMIPLNNPGINYDPKTGYASYKIKAFVVPLYKKMYMDVRKAREVFTAIFNDSRYGIRTTKKHIFRMYMASSRSFKEHLGNQNIDPILKKWLLNSAMPRFVWCGEYINIADAANRTVSSLIVLDATEAGENWEDSFIFAAHKKGSLFYAAVDHTYKLIPLEQPFAGFLMYEHNLN